METEKYSDLTLVCQGEHFPVHKVVVCTQSPVLAAACDGAFRVRLAMTCIAGDAKKLMEPGGIS